MLTPMRVGVRGEKPRYQEGLLTPTLSPLKSGERESDRFCGTVALQLIGTCSACGTQKHSDYVLRERGLRDLNHADALHRRMGAAVATML